MKTVNDILNALKKDMHKFLNRDVTSFVNEHKSVFAGGIVLVLLACVGVYITYAYYQISESTPVYGGSVGQIADVDIRIKVEDRDINGNGNGKYIDYAYIPKNKNSDEPYYTYNAQKSKCSNSGAEAINFDTETFTAEITVTGHDICYLYFDANAQVDLTLSVYIQKDDTLGNSASDYYLLDADKMPPLGYDLNSTLTTCSSGLSVKYLASTNMFSVESSGKGHCEVYMQKVKSDIELIIEVPDGNNDYENVAEIPKNKYYTLNEASKCYVTENVTAESTIELQYQRAVISLGTQAYCLVRLDEGTGPIIASITPVVNNNTATITITSATSSTEITKWYYSSDNTTDPSEWDYETMPTITINNASTVSKLWIYAEDGNELKSAIWEVELS